MPTDDYVSGAGMSQDKTERCSDDQKLRRFGFKVVSRVPGQEPVWVKDGLRYVQSEALLRVQSLVRSVETNRK